MGGSGKVGFGVIVKCDCKVWSTLQSKWGDLIQVWIMVKGLKRPSSHLLDDKCEYRSKSVTQGVRGQEDALWTWQGGCGVDSHPS